MFIQDAISEYGSGYGVILIKFYADLAAWSAFPLLVMTIMMGIQQKSTYQLLLC